MNNEQSPFRVGQRVVCVESVVGDRTNTELGESLIYGRIYEVKEVFIDDDYQISYWVVVVVGLDTWWDSKSFAPITESYEDITASLAAEGMNTYDQPDVIKIKELQN